MGLYTNQNGKFLAMLTCVLMDILHWDMSYNLSLKLNFLNTNEFFTSINRNSQFIKLISSNIYSKRIFENSNNVHQKICLEQTCLFAILHRFNVTQSNFFKYVKIKKIICHSMTLSLSIFSYKLTE